MVILRVACWFQSRRRLTAFQRYWAGRVHTTVQASCILFLCSSLRWSLAAHRWDRMQNHTIDLLLGAFIAFICKWQIRAIKTMGALHGNDLRVTKFNEQITAVTARYHSCTFLERGSHRHRALPRAETSAVTKAIWIYQAVPVQAELERPLPVGEQGCCHTTVSSPFAKWCHSPCRDGPVLAKAEWFTRCKHWGFLTRLQMTTSCCTHWEHRFLQLAAALGFWAACSPGEAGARPPPAHQHYTKNRLVEI